MQALGVSPFMLLSDGVMRPVTVLSYVAQVGLWYGMVRYGMM